MFLYITYQTKLKVSNFLRTMSANSDTTTQEYVEIIHDIQKKNKVARVKDIADQRGVCRSSVSTVLNMLKKQKLVIHEQYGLVELTTTGKRLGNILARRHETIFSFLTEILGVPVHIAEEDACKLEHHISPETVEYLNNFLAFFREHFDNDWLARLKKFNHS